MMADTIVCNYANQGYADAVEGRIYRHGDALQGVLQYLFIRQKITTFA